MDLEMSLIHRFLCILSQVNLVSPKMEMESKHGEGGEELNQLPLRQTSRDAQR